MRASGIVTLLTDFGTRDPWVGVMKGVILSRFAAARIVDLTHEVPSQDVLRGALFLADVLPWFPAGTVHLVVVDPGVGTSRGALVADLGGQLLVAPDNGLLTAAERVAPLNACHLVARDDLCLPDRSLTFHGRDVFAPVAAALASGEVGVADVGPALVPARIRLPEPVPLPDGVRGEVTHADRFGNLITCIPVSSLPQDRSGSPRSAMVAVAGRTIPGFARTYGDAAPGSLVALIGSTGLVEIALVEGSAAEKLAVGRGAQVTVIW